MAGRKLSAQTEVEVVFMEGLLMQLVGLNRKVEEYAACKTKAAEGMVQVITRHLAQFRQQAMMKNLGPLADAAGTLGILCSRGSQTQRTRTMREGIINFKQLIERMMKATIDADGRLRAENERVVVANKATAAAARAALEAPALETPEGQS